MIVSPLAAPLRPPYLSRALLTGVLFELPCERVTLAAWLGRFGALAPGGAGATASGDYPVYCEIWFVHDGALSAGIADVPGSRAVARAAGTYRESLVWVPDVRLAGGPGASFVVGMLTDGALARWADAALGFGYDKRPGRFEVDADGGVRVHGPSGRRELQFTPEPGVHAGVPEVTELDRFAAMPLLGVTSRGAFVHSWLERRFTEAPRFPLAGALALSDYLVPGCRRRYEVGTAASGARGFAFTALGARLTYPRRV